MRLLPLLTRELSRIYHTAKKNSPIILVGLGIGGFVTTAVMSAKATPKARKAIANAENEKCETMTSFEKFKVGAPYYIPTVAMGIVSTTCILGSTKICYTRQATLMTLLSASEARFTDYYNKTLEVVGDKKAEKIRKAVYDDKAATVNREGSSTPVKVGEVLAVDYTFGREFSTTGNKVMAAQNRVNAILSKGADTYVSLNDAYEALDMTRTGIGDRVGWNSADLGIDGICFDYHYSRSEDGQPLLVMEFDPLPYVGFDDVWGSR
jgi:hypothetical protein